MIVTLICPNSRGMCIIHMHGVLDSSIDTAPLPIECVRFGLPIAQTEDPAGFQAVLAASRSPSALDCEQTEGSAGSMRVYPPGYPPAHFWTST